MTPVLTGIDVLRRDDFVQLRGQRIGLLTNHSGVTYDLVPTYRLLHDAENVDLVALFGPEHGVMGMAAEGEQVSSGTDAHTGLPVYSLYGAQVRPTAAMLADIELLVCDIQDIGTRYYTYLWTLTHVLEACGEAGVRVLVLDRPNPLGGERVSGPGLDAEFSSLVGRFDIPIQHGMTLGELAQMLNDTVNPTPAPVDVIRCEGYTRTMLWEHTGLPFVPPSPNMPSVVTTQHYPGSCLVEGTNLSEGRGTTLPFQIVGAPYIAADALADTLNALALPGCRFRPHRFRPSSRKYADEVCDGVQVHITATDQYEPITTWLHVLATIARHYPEQFEWLNFFDKLIGSTQVRQQLAADTAIAILTASWDAYEAVFRTKRAPYLLY